MSVDLERTDRRVDEIMGLLLRTGVILAASMVLLGGIVYLLRHPGPTINYRSFHGEPQEYKTVTGIFRDAMTFHGRGLIQLGLLLLIATPVTRVLFSVFAFLYERDWKYVIFTLIVLGLLMFSLFGR